MTLNIYVSITGQQFSAYPAEFTSVQSLKSWIAEKAGVVEVNQILMTANGKNVKQQHIVAGSDIFLYNKEILAKEDDVAFEDEDILDRAELREPPSQLEDETNIQAWQDLFKRRRTWAQEALRTARFVSDNVSRILDICEVVDRATIAALENLRTHVNNMRQTYDKTQRWAHDTLAEYETLLNDWTTDVGKLENLPVRKDLAVLLNITMPILEDEVNMIELLEPNSAESDVRNLQKANRSFRERADDMTEQMDNLQVATDSAALVTQVAWPVCEAHADVQEVETLFTQISSDYDEVLSIANDPKSLTRISRLAASHTNDYLPAIRNALTSCYEALAKSRAFRTSIRTQSHQALRKISSIQSSLASLHHALSTLALDKLSQTSLENLERSLHMPVAYGSILIEATRRSEWVDQLKQIVHDVEADFAHHQEAELKMRKKWISTMLPHLRDRSAVTDSTAVNIVMSDQTWPRATRADVFDYIDLLRHLELNQAVEQITPLLKSLDSMSKARRVRAKPFSDDIVHDSVHGTLLRGDDENKTLQDDKHRLEDKLKASESRVRKLEDLVHKQEQSSRTVNSGFSPFQEIRRSNDLTFGTELPQSPQKSPSSLQRRSNNQTDESLMAKRIVTLEAHVDKLQQAAYEERRSNTESREKMEEAEAIKRDLLANFGIHRQEFEDERRKLEEDNQELKNRLEELEEELDRMAGSRDHEKGKQEQVVSHFRQELERLRKTSNEEINAMQTTKETLEHKLVVQNEKLAKLESLLDDETNTSKHARTESERYSAMWRQLQDQQGLHVATLQAAHGHLSPAGSPPDKLDRLANALEVLAEGAAFHAKGLDDALQSMTARAKAAERRNSDLEAELEHVRARNERLVEELSTKSIRASDLLLKHDELQRELLHKTEDLSKLHADIAAGINGSESLNAKLEEAEDRLRRLMESDAVMQATNRSLQTELVNKENELRQSEDKCATLQANSASREDKIRTMSERLFHNNDCMVRILESFGYSITRQDNGLLIQRASKANASTILLTDHNPSMRRTVSSSIPTQHFNDENDLACMYWIRPGDMEAEERMYHSFVTALNRLDFECTVDIITKRYKDVEALAKKYQKDSRTLKERIHRSQSESHDKIAYRAFKEGDLALFLPTRNQVTRSWAAFNVGAPHYFLHEQDTHKLQSREWLLARINKIDERIVDLSRSTSNAKLGASTSAEAGDGASTRSLDDENPFELSDGLRWYMIDAVEEKAGAPSTPGLSKTTVAASVVDVQAQMGTKSTLGRVSSSGPGAVNAAKTLHKSLDSRRSSEASRKSSIAPIRPSVSNSSAIAAMTSAGTDGLATGQMSPAAKVRPSNADMQAQGGGQARADAKVFDVARTLSDVRAPPSDRTAQLNSPQDRISSPSKSQPKPWDKLFSFQFQA